MTAPLALVFDPSPALLLCRTWPDLLLAVGQNVVPPGPVSRFVGTVMQRFLVIAHADGTWSSLRWAFDHAPGSVVFHRDDIFAPARRHQNVADLMRAMDPRERQHEKHAALALRVLEALRPDDVEATRADLALRNPTLAQQVDHWLLAPAQFETYRTATQPAREMS